MPAAALHANEADRLRKIAQLKLDALLGDDNLQALTRCAARAAGTPMAMISIVEASRQYFICRIGTDDTETPRERSFCAHTILSAAPLVVPDATLDPRFADNPVVTGDPFIRAYLGVPLVTSDRAFALGSLCVVDYRPRAWTGSDIAMAMDLAAVAQSFHEWRDEREEFEYALSSMTGN